MEDFMVNVKVPREKKVPTVFMSDLFDEYLFVCYENNSLEVAICCSDCAYQGTPYCNFANRFKNKEVCVEGEEVTTAVAGVGKSSERDSEIASSGEFQSEALC